MNLHCTELNMKSRLIINPISGTRSKAGLDDQVKEMLAPLGWSVEVVYTQCHGDATRLASDAVGLGYDAVFAAGGDGTINETAAALCGSRTVLGIIPCGSGNGLARHLGIPIDIKEGIKVILENHPMPIDFATVNDRKFFCTFGVGFDAAVSAAFARKKTRGKFTYLQSTFETYANYEPEYYTISANGKMLTKKAFLVAVCNASQYGNNAYIAPTASITDGLLDITIIHAGTPFDTALVGMDLFTGYINSNTMIHTFRAPSAVIYRQSEGPAHLDGEPVTIDDTMAIKCHANALPIFTPSREIEFRPIITPIENALKDLASSFNRLIARKV